MRIEILGEVSRVCGHSFSQKTLPTQIVWDGITPLSPSTFTVYRFSCRTHVYRGPEGEQWSYDQLLDHHRVQGVKFPGTYHFLEAVDIELFQDQGSDGHIEWCLNKVLRVFIHPSEDDENPEQWLHNVSGDILQRMLSDTDWERTRKDG